MDRVNRLGNSATPDYSMFDDNVAKMAIFPAAGDRPCRTQASRVR